MPAKSLGKHRAFELYSLAKPRAQRADRDADEIEYEKFCDECTFAPDLTSTKNRYDYASPKSFYVKRKGLQKAITRIRDGREQRQQRKKFREGRSEKDARILRKIKKTRLAEQKLSNKKESDQQKKQQITEEDDQDIYQDPRNFYVDNPIQEEEDRDYDEDGVQHPFEEKVQQKQDQQDENESHPLLFVDVNLGNNKQERIIVKEGDKAEDLASAFALEHGLDDDMREKLVDLLNLQIQHLLTRIDEDIQSQYSSQALENEGTPTNEDQHH